MQNTDHCTTPKWAYAFVILNMCLQIVLVIAYFSVNMTKNGLQGLPVLWSCDL